MNGAESLARTLVAGGVNVCFTNPGTSEMHFVAALDKVDGIRCVLGLFEGVVTGAADGYWRMADGPAATLLHLGPGLGNGLANLHNARRARTPVVNIVGDHATYHKQYDAPLESDIDAVAETVSVWVRRSMAAADVGRDAADPGQPSDLVPDGCTVHELPPSALGPLADLVAADTEPVVQPALRPDRPTGPLTGETLAGALGALLPEGAVVVDEANTSGLWASG